MKESQSFAVRKTYFFVSGLSVNYDISRVWSWVCSTGTSKGVFLSHPGQYFIGAKESISSSGAAGVFEDDMTVFLI